jgi:hypothetical protein
MSPESGKRPSPKSARATRLRDLWERSEEAVQEILMRRSLVYEDAFSLVTDVMVGTMIPGEEEASARLFLETAYCLRDADEKRFVTFSPLVGLSSLETEFCMRAASLAGITGQLYVSHREGENLVPASQFLALTSIARASALAFGEISLYENENFLSAGMMYRPIMELWVFFRYLLLEPEAAVDTLIGAHRWRWKLEPEDDIVGALFGEAANEVRPQRPIIPVMVTRVREGLLDTDPAFAKLLQGLYDEIYGGMSHLYVHTSLLGLLRHVHLSDEGVHLSVQPRLDDELELPMLLIMTGVLLSDMVTQTVKVLNIPDAVGEDARELDKLMLEVLATRAGLSDASVQTPQADTPPLAGNARSGDEGGER